MATILDRAGSGSDLSIPVSSSVCNVAVKNKVPEPEVPEPEMIKKGQFIHSQLMSSPSILSVDNELRPYVCKVLKRSESFSFNHLITRARPSRTPYTHFTAGDHQGSVWMGK